MVKEDQTLIANISHSSTILACCTVHPSHNTYFARMNLRAVRWAIPMDQTRLASFIEDNHLHAEAILTSQRLRPSSYLVSNDHGLAWSSPRNSAKHMVKGSLILPLEQKFEPSLLQQYVFDVDTR